MAEPSLGLVPDLTGTLPLVRAVGYAQAVDICLTGRRVPADEALRIGLVNSVVPNRRSRFRPSTNSSARSAEAGRRRDQGNPGAAGQCR